MKEFKEEHIDPEQYWPGAASLLENHYKAKRRRKAIVLLGAVLIGLLSVYLINTEKSVLTVENNTPKKEIVKDNSGQSNIDVLKENETMIPSNKNKEKRIEGIEANQISNAEYERKISVIAPKNQTTSIKKNTPKRVTKKERNTVAAKVSSGQHASLAPSNPVNTFASTPSSPQVNQTNQIGVSNLTVPSRREQSFGSHVSAITETNFADVEYISSLPLLKWEQTPVEETSIQHDNRPELRNKKKVKWDLLVYAGINDVQKELTGKSDALYLLRREREEAPALLPFGGIQLSKSIQNWDFRGGLEFTVVGEQVKYSPYAKGDYLSQYDDWIPNNYVVTDTDSAYIWGILFLNTTDYTVLDSVLVTKTDTLNGVHYNSTIRNANGINRWYVMELPLEVSYQFRMKRWGIGISAGIAPGMVVQSSGYYLKEDESGYASIKKFNKQQFTLNARAGLEFSYLLNTRCRLLLRPSSQYSLLKMDAGTNDSQRYRRNGISVGLLYMIP